MISRCLVLLLAVASLGADDPKVVLGRIAFGSCLDQDKAQPVWDGVLAYKPDLFIFAGDNIYGDSDDMAVLRGKYKQLGEQKGYQAVLKMCPVVATWDDHDYGANDAGANFKMRDESQQVFLDFFGAPRNDPRRSRKGVYDSYIFGPPDKSVQVILLDTRYHRGPLRKRGKVSAAEGPYEANFDKSTTILGEEQWKWLGEELKKPARLRLIVSSIQVVSQDHGWEKWANMPHERDRLFKLLQETKANGVVLLTGDRHLAELSVADVGLGYPLFDLTASGMNQGFPRFRMPEANRHRVYGMSHGNHFGTITVDWSKPDPELRLQIRDEAGDVALQEKIGLDVLKPGLMKSQAAAAEAKGVTLDGQPADEALIKKLLDKEVTLEMPVVLTGQNKTGTLIFLNSSKGRDNPLGFTVVIPKKVADQMKADGIADPRVHFGGKTIRVVGPLTMFQDRPQIMLPAASSISLKKE